MPRVTFRRDGDGRHIRQLVTISSGKGPPCCRPPGQQSKPLDEDCGLHLVQARVHAELRVVVSRCLSAVPQALCACKELWIAGRESAAIPQGAKVLGGIEAVRRGGAEAADRPPPAGGQVRLAAVFDNRQVVTLRHCHDGGHVSRLSVEVHRQDRGGARGHGGQCGAGIERDTNGIDVCEDGSRPGHHDRQRRIRRRHRRGDDLVARANTQRA